MLSCLLSVGCQFFCFFFFGRSEYLLELLKSSGHLKIINAMPVVVSSLQTWKPNRDFPQGSNLLWTNLAWMIKRNSELTATRTTVIQTSLGSPGLHKRAFPSENKHIWTFQQNPTNSRTHPVAQSLDEADSLLFSQIKEKELQRTFVVGVDGSCDSGYPRIWLKVLILKFVALVTPTSEVVNPNKLLRRKP